MPHPRPPHSIPCHRSHAKSSASSRMWAPVFIARNGPSPSSRDAMAVLFFRSRLQQSVLVPLSNTSSSGRSSLTPSPPSLADTKLWPRAKLLCSRHCSCSSGVDETDSSQASPTSCMWASQPQPSCHPPSRLVITTNPPRRMHLLWQHCRARTPMAKLRRSLTLDGVLLLAAASTTPSLAPRPLATGAAMCPLLPVPRRPSAAKSITGLLLLLRASTRGR